MYNACLLLWLVDGGGRGNGSPFNPSTMGIFVVLISFLNSAADSSLVWCIVLHNLTHLHQLTYYHVQCFLGRIFWATRFSSPSQRAEWAGVKRLLVASVPNNPEGLGLCIWIHWHSDRQKPWREWVKEFLYTPTQYIRGKENDGKPHPKIPRHDRTSWTWPIWEGLRGTSCGFGFAKLSAIPWNLDKVTPNISL